MPVTRKKPAVEWWAVAQLASQLQWKDVHHATFGAERDTTLCGLSLAYDPSIPVEERLVSKRMRSHVLPSGERVKPCMRCTKTIERHKKMYGVTEADWPYSAFREESNA